MSNSTSRITSFYLGKNTDDKGRMIDDILSWDDRELELVHDYIQWLFPLKEASAYNASAPVITEEEIDEFVHSDALRSKLRESFIRLLNFYGFECFGEEGNLNVRRSAVFERQASNWLTVCNHNFLRITRILKCLSMLGPKDCAVAFMDALEEIYNEHSETIGFETLSYWRDALY